MSEIPAAFFRANHIGSLLRPEELKAIYRAYEAGEASQDERCAVEDRHIRRVVAHQRDLGLRSITDGEYRRLIYFGHFCDACSGFTMMESDAGLYENDKAVKYLSPVVTSKVRRLRPIAAHELGFVSKLAVPGVTQKVTLPSPADMHAFRYREGVSDQAGIYPELEEFFEDIAAIYRQELAELARNGARHVQLDDTTFTLFCDPKWRGRFEERGYDAEAFIGRYADWINRCIEDRPEGLTVGLHQCRGNNQGDWLFSGGYDAIAERLFAALNVDTFFLEYDSERAGGFEPLRFIPRDKTVVLGLVCSKTPVLEDADVLRRRIDAATRYFPIERMGLSPQCGFASTLPGNPLSEEHQWAKLSLVVDVARRTWGTA
jgi:5-methyltetrahydropteroyltriglutamate--homocysteine methyltransferase